MYACAVLSAASAVLWIRSYFGYDRFQLRRLSAAGAVEGYQAVVSEKGSIGFAMMRLANAGTELGPPRHDVVFQRYPASTGFAERDRRARFRATGTRCVGFGFALIDELQDLGPQPPVAAGGAPRYAWRSIDRVLLVPHWVPVAVFASPAAWQALLAHRRRRCRHNDWGDVSACNTIGN